jgi:hypothetical protein
MVKFAFIVMYELRSIHKTLANLYDNIINYYDADIIIVCQETFENDQDNLNLFDKKVIYKSIYKKPCPLDYFDNGDILLKNGQNWNTNSSLQIYINYKEMSKIIEKYKDDYDYFISLRTDIEILYPLPPPNIFEKVKNGIYSYNPKYCKTFGGWSTGVFIHKDYILNYLNACYDVIIDKNTKFEEFSRMNQERFIVNSLKKKNLKFKYIENLNIYFTVTNLTDRTTWNRPKIHPKYNIMCKKIDQVDEAYENLNLWNDGHRWVYENDQILLKK